MLAFAVHGAMTSRSWGALGVGSCTSCVPGADGLRAVSPSELGVAVGVAVALIWPLLHNSTVNKLPLRAARSKSSIAASGRDCRVPGRGIAHARGEDASRSWRSADGRPVPGRRSQKWPSRGREAGAAAQLDPRAAAVAHAVIRPDSSAPKRHRGLCLAAALAPADEPYPSARGEQLLTSSRNQQGQDHGVRAILQIIVFRPHGGLNRRDSNG
jgi:hypothetical protein